MNRIELRMNELKKEKRKAFITYMTAGLPDYNTTKDIIRESYKAGLDVLEIGVPFSDPVADGPVIQDASYRAILNGANLTKTFKMMREIREEKIELPIVFMMYYNQIYNMGLKTFVLEAIKAGVDGLIIPDLPFEEEGELKEVLNAYENAPILIQLVSPVSRKRLPMLLKGARGFVYCVSQMGVTGSNESFHKEIRNYLESVKANTDLPIMIGFGIRTCKDLEGLVDIVDGAIVGSHFIKLLDANDFSGETAREYIEQFMFELNGQKVL